MLETIMNIADSFFRLNDILINHNKAVLITNNDAFNNKKAIFQVNNASVFVHVEAQTTPVRVLGVWISISRQKMHIIK